MLKGAKDEVDESRNRLESDPRTNSDNIKKELENTDTLKKNSTAELKNQFEKPEIEVEKKHESEEEGEEEEELKDDDQEDMDELEDSSPRDKKKQPELKAQMEMQAVENEKSESKRSNDNLF